MGSNTDSPWTGSPTGRDGHPDICLERLARMASVDGQWWQDCDRQMRRRATVWHYWLYGLLGAGIGLAISAAGVAYQTLG